MDIQKIISELIPKLTGNKDLISKFTADPLGAIKDLLGIELDKDQLDEVVKGVTEKLGGNVGEIVNEGKGLLDKIKSLFGK